MIMESSTDAAEWKLEVERVLPQLKITVRTDNKVMCAIFNMCITDHKDQYFGIHDDGCSNVILKLISAVFNLYSLNN